MSTSEVLSVILAVLTGVYVFYTARLNQHARSNAASAERAASSSATAASAAVATAEASQRAAEAAERSAALSEAAVQVDFSARVVSTSSKTLVMLKSETVNVRVFSVDVRLLVVPGVTGDVRDLVGSTSYVGEASDSLFVHRGDEVFAVLTSMASVGDRVMGSAAVRYGFQADGQIRERLVHIPNQTVVDAV